MTAPLESQPLAAHTPRVMIVDDEEMVTVSLSSMLEIETDYQPVSYQSPAEALGYLQAQPVDVIVSDFLMPEMDGLEFLTKARELYPEVPRIILTGYADKENAIKAINQVGLYQYIEKPWDNDHLKLVIRNALSDSGLRTSLNQKIKELDRVLADRERLVRDGHELRRELTMARELQQRLLPGGDADIPNLDLVATYQPAMDVGGDFYDVIKLADGRFGVLVADATGHGVQASLSTALLKFAFSAFAGSTAGPAEILRGMNKVLYTGLPSDIFIAGVVAVVDTDARQARISNGGLPHPYLIRKDDSAARIPAEGLLLGVVDDNQFRSGDEHTIDLHPGECMLLYTDGLTEATNADGRLFIDDGLVDLLQQCSGKSVREIVTLLTRAANDYAENGAYKDDMTILGMAIQTNEE